MSDPVVVIGAGVVGLASAVSLARASREVMIVERGARVGAELSSRNSGVVHAGLYYPPGSLKARTCVRGRQLLAERALREGLPYRRVGKLIVATQDAELEQLHALARRAEENGAGLTRMRGASELRALEPSVRALAALEVEETAIVDTRALVGSLYAELIARGGSVWLGAELIDAQRTVGGYSLRLADGRVLEAPRVVIAAGLRADRVLALFGVDLGAAGLRHRYARGAWMRVASRHQGRFSRLVYPLPAEGGLGVHLTFDLESVLHAGPDVEWIDDPEAPLPDAALQRSSFGAALRRFFPDLLDQDLEPAMHAIRPKLHGPDERFADFVVRECSALGAPGVVACLGIESPGLSASLALGEEVAALAR